MIGIQGLPFFLIFPRNKFQQGMFLGVVDTVFLNMSNNLSHLKLWIPSVQIDIIMSFDIKLNGSKNKIDCIP